MRSKMSYTSITLLIMCCYTSKSISTERQHQPHWLSPQNDSHADFQQNKISLHDANLQNNTYFNVQRYRMNSTLHQSRESRSKKIVYPTTPTENSYYSHDYNNHLRRQYYDSMPPVLNKNEISTTLESPMLYMQPRQGYASEPEHYDDYLSSYPIVTTTEAYEESTTEETTEEEIPTTTLAPFTLADVKVPAPFLRIEYMISFTFFGIMYGLGFFVLFQSLCVPAAKIAVYIVYYTLLKLGVVDPVTLEQALEQLPPT